MKARSLIQFINPKVGGVDISIDSTRDDKSIGLFIEFAKPMGASGKVSGAGVPLTAYGWSLKDAGAKAINTVKLQLSFKEVVRLSAAIDKSVVGTEIKFEHISGNIAAKYLNAKFSEINGTKQMSVTATKVMSDKDGKKNITSGYYFKNEELAALNYIFKSFLINYVPMVAAYHNSGMLPAKADANRSYSGDDLACP